MNRLMKLKAPKLIGAHWRKAGETVEVSGPLAEHLLRSGDAVFAGFPVERASLDTGPDKSVSRQ